MGDGLTFKIWYVKCCQGPFGRSYVVGEIAEGLKSSNEWGMDCDHVLDTIAIPKLMDPTCLSGKHECKRLK